jgi:OHCU decarboxylase
MMAAARPFAGPEALSDAADAVWLSLADADRLEAFAAHPQIGADIQAGSAGQAGVEPRWAAHEQSGVRNAATDVRDRLAQLNRDYQARFGYIFIVCATGKTADEMLAMLARRIANDPDAELAIAAEEQRKITQLRLVKLLT